MRWGQCQASRRAGILAGILIALIANPVFAQVAALLGRSTRVADVSDWYVSGAENIGTFYRWISNEEVLLVRWDSGFHFYRRNLRTQVERALPDLDKVYRSLQIPGAYGVGAEALPTGLSEFELSPDGRHILLSNRYDIVITTLVGKEVFRKRYDTDFTDSMVGVSDAWLSDSRHWVVFLWKYLPNQEWTIPRTELYSLAASSPLKQLLVWPEKRETLNFLSAVSVAGSMRNITLTFLRNSGVDGQVWQRRYSGKRSYMREYTLRLPKGVGYAGWGDARFSPQGDRLAWWVTSEGANKIRTMGLWIGRIDGKQMRELDRLEVDSEADRQRLTPRNLRWLPDGKRLSFIYKKALYTIPVD